MVSKNELHQLVDSLPEEIDEDDLMYALYVRRNLAAGYADSEAGRTVPHEEVLREVAKWRKSAGR